MSLLFSPIDLGSVTVRNRLWMPPMCTYSAESGGIERGRPRQFHLTHYGSRSIGGTGLIFVEATAVTPVGRITPFDLCLDSDSQIPSFAALATEIVAGGAIPAIQLGHAGRKASSRPMWEGGDPLDVSQGGWATVGPSAVAFNSDSPVPHELSEDEIRQVIELFVAAARRAVAAGFQVIQLHAAHGYLLQSFLSPFSNQRTDGWGGDFAGRTRLLREISLAVMAEIGPQIPLVVRISATDWTVETPGDGRPGWTIEESVKLAAELKSIGVALMDVSTGGNVHNAKIPAAPGYQVPHSQAVRETGLPTTAVGIITAPTQAEQILVTKAADAIEVGRALLTDPYLPHKWRAALREKPELPPQYRRGLAL